MDGYLFLSYYSPYLLGAHTLLLHMRLTPADCPKSAGLGGGACTEAAGPASRNGPGLQTLMMAAEVAVAGQDTEATGTVERAASHSFYLCKMKCEGERFYFAKTQTGL